MIQYNTLNTKVGLELFSSPGPEGGGSPQIFVYGCAILRFDTPPLVRRISAEYTTFAGLAGHFRQIWKCLSKGFDLAGQNVRWEYFKDNVIRQRFYSDM